MPPDPPSKSASGDQQDLGLNEHPYLTLAYAPDICVSAVFFLFNMTRNSLIDMLRSVFC